MAAGKQPLLKREEPTKSPSKHSVDGAVPLYRLKNTEYRGTSSITSGYWIKQLGKSISHNYLKPHLGTVNNRCQRIGTSALITSWSSKVEVTMLFSPISFGALVSLRITTFSKIHYSHQKLILIVHIFSKHQIGWNQIHLWVHAGKQALRMAVFTGSQL